MSILPVEADDSISDIRQERKQALEAEAAALKEIDYLIVEDERVAELLSRTQVLIDAQAAGVERARQAQRAADDEVIRRNELAIRAAEDITFTEQAIQLRVIDAYVGATATRDSWTSSDDINRSAVRQSLLEFAAGSEQDLLDRLRTLRSEHDEHLIAAREASEEAKLLRLGLEQDLDQLEIDKDQQKKIQEELTVRKNKWQAEADQRGREAEEFTQIIRAKQAEALAGVPGVPGPESTQGFIVPASGSIGSKFGPRTHPIFGGTRHHAGIDIGGTTGHPIWASKQGKVIFAGTKGGYGKTVVITHAGNLATLYAHMSQILVTEDDVVDTGEVIGLIGSTGWSTGPHLHFEVRVDGKPKDPMLFIEP